MLSRAGRHTLVTVVLSSMLTYHLTMFLLAVWARNKIDKIRRSFFWKGEENANGGPASTSLCALILRFNTMRSAMFMINICVFNHPFKIFRNREHKGVEDLVWVNVRETK
jgi:hypothetical protein